MDIVLEYTRRNYITLILLLGHAVILYANRKTKIEGVKYVWSFIVIVMALTLFEYLECWCIDYPDIHKSIRNFSVYLRSNFDNISGSHKLTFAQELKNIRAYLELEKMNFGDDSLWSTISRAMTSLSRH